MFLRSESDFVWAANAAHDLAAIVSAYLTLFRKHINGSNDVYITDEPFAVTFTPSTKEGNITINLWWTAHHSTEVTQYYDVDDDMFSEHWGADNLCGVSIQHSTSRENMQLNIPIQHLMRNEENMKADFVSREAKMKSDKAEARRVARIAELKSELIKLETKK